MLTPVDQISRARFPRLVSILICAFLLLVGAGALLGFRIARIEDAHGTLPENDVVDINSSQGALVLTPVFPTRSKPARIFVQYPSSASPQLVELPGLPPMLVVASADGVIAAVDPETGRTLWNVRLPCDPSDDILLSATPVRVNDKLIVAYSWHHLRGAGGSHHAAVVDLRRGALDYRFPILEFSATVSAAEPDETIQFDPTVHQLRSALARVPFPTGLGRVYVSFGSIMDQMNWHGWLFELDLDKWMLGFPTAAISAVFTTTPRADCNDFVSDNVCGGGLWAHAGPLIYQSPDGFEILVQSGNGILDVNRGMYGNSLLRLRPGLKFTPACDPQLCSDFNRIDPSPVCLTSCKDLFVPRLMSGDAPLHPADGSCDGKSYLQCLNINDWDFGGNAPARVSLDDGHAVYVAAGKAGDVFLLDADTLGIIYDRKQVLDSCGTIEVPCPDTSQGLIMTQPKIAWVNGSPVVMIPTYNLGPANSAGIVAYKIIHSSGRPRLEELWRAPARSSDEAKQWFRTAPTRMALENFDHKAVGWIGDSSGQGRLLGISVSDGRILANIRTAGKPLSNTEPIIYGNMLCLSTLTPWDENHSWINGYRISTHDPGSALR
jgi:hypothetical protein